MSRMHWMAREGNEAGIRECLSQGYEVDAKNKFGRSALELAVQSGHLEVVRALIEAGADANGTSEKCVPVVSAARANRRDIFEVLIEAGADLDKTDPMSGLSVQALLEGGGLEGVGFFDESRRLWDERHNTPDLWDGAIRGMMNEYTDPDEYAAHNGYKVITFSLHLGTYTDPVVGAWARRFGEIVNSPDLLNACELRFLSDEELSSRPLSID